MRVAGDWCRSLSQGSGDKCSFYFLVLFKGPPNGGETMVESWGKKTESGSLLNREKGEFPGELCFFLLCDGNSY